jgi:hypothetical protein
MDPKKVDKLTFIYTNTRSLRADRSIILEPIIEEEELGLEEDRVVLTVLGKRKRIYEQDDDEDIDIHE